jgi:hypothetical protein
LDFELASGGVKGVKGGAGGQTLSENDCIFPGRGLCRVPIASFGAENTAGKKQVNIGQRVAAAMDVQINNKHLRG